MTGTFFSSLVVTTPATSNRLTTKEHVRGDLNIKSGKDDVYIDRLIDSVSDAVTQYCERVFAQQSYTLTLSTDHRPSSSQFWNLRESIPLWPSPVTTVTSVTENAVALVSGADYVADLGPPPPTPPMPAALYRLDSNGNPRTWPRLSIVIAYAAGYTLPSQTKAGETYTLPRSLEDVVIRLIKDRYFARDRDSLLRSESVPGVGDRQYWIDTGKDGDFSPDVREVLDRYRVPTIG